LAKKGEKGKKRASGKKMGRVTRKKCRNFVCSGTVRERKMGVMDLR